MRFPFRELPAAGGGDLTPRPVVDVWLEGMEQAPIACLVDTGALRTRLPADLADIAGIDLGHAPRERVALAGTTVDAAPARVSLRLETPHANKQWEWDAPVWFCDPWPFAFGLLGLDGFLRHFRITVSAYHEWLECRAED